MTTQTLTRSIVQRRVLVDRLSISVVAPCTALGLVSIAVADIGSRRGHSATAWFFWLGLLLLFVPVALVSLKDDIDRRERMALVVLLGIGLYLVKLFGSPHAFTFSDEFIHLRNTQDILRTRHLFALNPLLPTAAYYPGLAATTAALVNLTSLSPFVAGLVVMAVARVLFSALFFQVAEHVTGSSRAAAGASLLYAANPMFLFWGSTFAYENLALPLAVFVVWWLGHTLYSSQRASQAVTLLGIAAVVVTHHVVGFALAGLLGAWWLAQGYTQRASATADAEDRAARRRVGFMAIVASAATLIWFAVVAKPAASYLFLHNIFPALRQTGSLLLGDTPRRALYKSGGYVAPTWETVAGAAAVGILLLALPPALYRAWRRRDHTSMLIAAALAALFPLSLAPRLAPDGVAISGRSSEYIFVGLACVLGQYAVHATWRRRGSRHGPTRRVAPNAAWRTAVIAGLMTIVFVGEVTIGTAFYERLPEASHPSGYPWSVQPDAITASKWARVHLGINQRFGANAIDAYALATYGEQDTVKEDNVWKIFFAAKMDRTVVQSIQTAGVRYLLVDTRMVRGVPPTPGYYFSPEEPHAGQYTQPFPGSGLQKFVTDSCTRLLYNHDSTKIFDVTRIENGTCVPPGAKLWEKGVAVR